MKTFKEKNEQEKQLQTNSFFSEGLLQETFSNLHVGQYNLFSNFITKQKNHRKENYCYCVWAAFLNEIIFQEKFPNYILTSMTTYQICFRDRTT